MICCMVMNQLLRYGRCNASHNALDLLMSTGRELNSDAYVLACGYICRSKVMALRQQVSSCLEPVPYCMIGWEHCEPSSVSHAALTCDLCCCVGQRPAAAAVH